MDIHTYAHTIFMTWESATVYKEYHTYMIWTASTATYILTRACCNKDFGDQYVRNSIHMYVCTRTVFSPEFISGMLYVHMYMHAYVHHNMHKFSTYVYTMHHKLLAASLLGTSMVCIKHKISTIYEYMLFPEKSIKF